MQYTTFKRKYNFRVVRVSPGSAETSVSGGGKVNHDLVAYFLSNMYAKNNQNRLMDVRVVACQVSVVFSERQYRRIFCSLCHF